MTLVSEEQLYALIDLTINLAKNIKIVGSLSIHFMIGFSAWLGVAFSLVRQILELFAE